MSERPSMSDEWPEESLELCREVGAEPPPFRMNILGYELVGQTDGAVSYFEWRDGLASLDWNPRTGEWCIGNMGYVFGDDVPDGWDIDRETMVCVADTAEEAVSEYRIKRAELYQEFRVFTDRMFAERVGGRQ